MNLDVADQHVTFDFNNKNNKIKFKLNQLC